MPAPTDENSNERAENSSLYIFALRRIDRRTPKSIKYLIFEILKSKNQESSKFNDVSQTKRFCENNCFSFYLSVC